jgi:hypothetical protein
LRVFSASDLMRWIKVRVSLCFCSIN